MKATLITTSVFLALTIGMIGYIIGLSKSTELNIAEAINNRWPDIDTTTCFENGQVLLPDYVHKDTLIVTDADYLNECMNDGQLKTDDDIFEILNETTVKYTLNKK